MWLSPKQDSTAKDLLFRELYEEVRLAAPGARLSYACRTKLERLSREERKELVTRIKDGCAPLFISCKKGNVEIVEYLIEECDADVEQKGVYEVPDDRSMHHVSPLWCAAVASRLSVVKCLVAKGANVNSVSDTGSTPVRSACFMTHLDIVTFLVESGADILKANYNGGTCLINSVQSVALCEFLLKNGAAVNAQDVQMKTALHYSIQEHRFDTTKLLLQYGADPFIKSRYGDDALQTACLKVAAQIFEYLIEHYNYLSERVAEAYELMGSTYLDEHYELETALRFWKFALNVRYDNGTELVIPKRDLVQPKPAYNGCTEFTTYPQLEALALDLDAMRTQSLLICERILGPTHKDMIFRLMYRGAAYADGFNYQRCIDLWRYALSLRISKDTLLHVEASFAASALARLFLDLEEKFASSHIKEEIHYEDVFGTIALLVQEISPAIKCLHQRPVFKRHQDSFDKILKVLTHLIYVLNNLKKTPQQEDETMDLISSILQLNTRNSAGDSLLHLVVSQANVLRNTSIVDEPLTPIFPHPGVTRLLIECGANVEATNNKGDSSLHIACTRSNYRPETVMLLLQNGAHIDRKSASNTDPAYFLSTIEDCPIFPMQFLTLKCLAARAIAQNGISFQGKIPVSLEDFIRIH